MGTAQAMLDVLDGRASVAAVAMTLPEAVAAAREAAWSEGRMLMVPAGITFHQVGTVERGAKPVGFVTVSAPSPQLLKVLAYSARIPAARSSPAASDEAAVLADHGELHASEPVRPCPANAIEKPPTS